MRYAFTIMIILIVGAVGFLIGRQQPMTSATPPASNVAQPAETGATQSTEAIKTVIGLGKLVPHNGLIQLMAPPGERVHYVRPFKVGDPVAQNQPLFYLQSRSIRERDLQLAQARRADAIRTAELEKDNLQLQRDVAEATLAEAMDGLKQIEVEQRQIQLLEEQRSAAQAILERMEALKTDPDTAELVSLPELEQQRLTVDQLNARVNEAHAKLELARGKSERAIQLAQLQLNAAEAALTQADQMVPIQSLNAAVELAQTALDMTEVRSPVDGQILDIIVADGDAATGRPVMVVGDTSQMDCVAEVNDTLLRLIPVDQYANQLRAKITSDALPHPICGTVEKKGVMIGPPSLKDPNPFARVDRRVGTVTIHLDDPATASRAVNLQVDVEIETVPGLLQPVEATSVETRPDPVSPDDNSRVTPEGSGLP